MQENITFGKAYEEEWYIRVVTACALTDDLAMLPWGDLTEIGERGINLSGKSQMFGKQERDRSWAHAAAASTLQRHTPCSAFFTAQSVSA